MNGKATKKSELGDDFQEQNIVIYPEWSESEVISEKWASKHAFEDPDGQPLLPKQYRQSLDTHKRASDIVGDTTSAILINSLNLIDDIFTSGESIIVPKFDRKDTSHIQKPSSSQKPSNHMKELSKAVKQLRCPLVSTPDKIKPHSIIEILETKKKLKSIPAKNKSEEKESKSKSLMQSDSLAPKNVQEKLLHQDSVKPLHFSKGSIVSGVSMGTVATTVVDIVKNDPLLGSSKLFLTNQYLFGSTFFVSILSAFHYLYDNAKQKKNPGLDESFPWDNIYPKSKDGAPTYNPSGRYIVKLFWLGSWRKITVDDKVPVDSRGNPLLISSYLGNEIWPFILSKALLKVANTCLVDENGDVDEFGDFDVLTALRGWMPEKINFLDPFNNQLSMDVLFKLWNRKVAAIQNGAAQSVVAKEVNKDTTKETGKENAKDSVKDRPRTQPKLVLDIPNIFLIKQRVDEEILSIDNIPVFYKIMDLNLKNVLIRPFFSTGSKYNEYADQWLPLDNLYHFFSKFVCYYQQNSFKTIKSCVHTVDPAKISEIYKAPNVLCTLEINIDFPEEYDYSSDGILLFISTFGRICPGYSLGSSTLLIQEYSEIPESFKNTKLKFTTNGHQTVLFKPKPNTDYVINFDHSNSLSMTLLSNEEFFFEDEAKYLTERKGYKAREFEEISPAQQAGSWNILFKHVLMVPEPMYIYTSLLTPESMALSTSVKAINNDTEEEMKQIEFGLAPQVFAPSKTGYTIIAENRSLSARPASKWKFRIFSTDISPTLLEKEGIFTKTNIQDFSEDYIQNKHNVMFRSILKIKDSTTLASIQTTFSSPNVWFKLQLFYNETELYSCKGKGVATISNVLMQLSDEPVLAASKPTKEDKKFVQPQVTSAQVVQPKHKYYLQATILPSEVQKLTNINAQGSSKNTRVRSSARNRKKPSTAGPITTTVTPTAFLNEGSTEAVELELSWNLRIITTDGASITVVKDTEKEDRYKLIKESWEVANPGRLVKAREIRENFLKLVDNNQITPPSFTINEIDQSNDLKIYSISEKYHPTVRLYNEKKPLNPDAPKSDKIVGNIRDEQFKDDIFTGRVQLLKMNILDHHRILEPKDFEMRSKERQLKIEKSVEEHGKLVKNRNQIKELRQLEKNRFIEIMEQKFREVELWQKFDLERREKYRLKNMKLKNMEAVIEPNIEQQIIDEALEKKKKPIKK